MGNLPLKNYLMKMKATCDILAPFGRPMSKTDQVLPILASLGPNYESTIAVLTLRDDSNNVKATSAYFCCLKVEFFNRIFLLSLHC